MASNINITEHNTLPVLYNILPVQLYNHSIKIIIYIAISIIYLYTKGSNNVLTKTSGDVGMVSPIK